MTTFFYKGDLPDNLLIEGDIAVDTEAMGLKNHRDRLCLVQLSNGDGNAHLVQIQQDKYHTPNLNRLLTDPNRVKILHFARFDVAIIQHYLGVMMQPLFCTKIASKLARTYTDRHGYKDICRELVGADISKQQQSSDWGNDDLTQEQMQYAASDVLHLHVIREKLTAMLKREKRLEIAESCFRFLPTRALLDLQGWPDDDIFAHQ